VQSPHVGQGGIRVGASARGEGAEGWERRVGQSRGIATAMPDIVGWDWMWRYRYISSHRPAANETNAVAINARRSKGPWHHRNGWSGPTGGKGQNEAAAPGGEGGQAQEGRDSRGENEWGGSRGVGQSAKIRRAIVDVPVEPPPDICHRGGACLEAWRRGRWSPGWPGT
jgi:hypothetical protein